MSDFDDLDEIAESNKPSARKDGRGAKLGNKYGPGPNSRQPFAAAKRAKPKPVTLATEPYHPDDHLNKHTEAPKIIIDK